MAGTETKLSSRLRGLRLRALGRTVTQRQLSKAFRVSNALISSWESGAALPTEERLHAYARFFSTDRSVTGDDARLLPDSELNEDESASLERLFDELIQLRETGTEEPVDEVPAPPETGLLGGRFLYFPDGQPITILCTPLSKRQLGWEKSDDVPLEDLHPVAQYAMNASHPNFVRNLSNGDVDALIELVGHLRAENPEAEVQWLTYDRVAGPDQLTGHLILFGGIDEQLGELPFGKPDIIRDFRNRMKTPVRLVWDSDGVEMDAEFVVSVDEDGHPTDVEDLIRDHKRYRSEFVMTGPRENRQRLVTDGAPQLTSDVALIQRGTNPFNPGATVTRFGGMFSRGTYGALRAFTDARFRNRNETWLDRYQDRDDFWMLISVPIVGNTTMTPGFARRAS